MDREQLMGRYVRLMDELAKVQDRPKQSRAWSDRLACDIAATAREIITLQPPDEQVSELPWAVLLEPTSSPRQALRRKPIESKPESELVDRPPAW